MIEPFKSVLGSFRYIYIAIDKFSKWIKYKPLISAIAKKVVELFEDIIHRFSLSNSIISDLRATFTSHHFGTSTKINASTSNTSLLLILEPMARSNGQTA